MWAEIRGREDVTDKRLKASRALKLKKEDQIYRQKVSEMAKKHSSEAFYARDDPLETAVFSVLVELIKERDQLKEKCVVLNVSGYT